jgi:hypothetical protein
VPRNACQPLTTNDKSTQVDICVIVDVVANGLQGGDSGFECLCMVIDTLKFEDVTANTLLLKRQDGWAFKKQYDDNHTLWEQALATDIPCVLHYPELDVREVLVSMETVYS